MDEGYKETSVHLIQEHKASLDASTKTEPKSSTKEWAQLVPGHYLGLRSPFYWYQI